MEEYLFWFCCVTVSDLWETCLRPWPLQIVCLLVTMEKLMAWSASRACLIDTAKVRRRLCRRTVLCNWARSLIASRAVVGGEVAGRACRREEKSWEAEGFFYSVTNVFKHVKLCQQSLWMPFRHKWIQQRQDLSGETRASQNWSCVMFFLFPLDKTWSLPFSECSTDQIERIRWIVPDLHSTSSHRLNSCWQKYRVLEDFEAVMVKIRLPWNQMRKWIHQHFQLCQDQPWCYCYRF